jgi:hypothetical protein
MARGTSRGEEGTLYVTSFGKVFVDRKIDADKILKYIDNVYLAGALDKQQRTLFRNKREFEINGVGPDGKPDEDLSERLTSMCKAKDVDAWFNAQIAWRESATWGPALFNPVWNWEGNEYVLQRLRHLPSETFNRRGFTTGVASTAFINVANPILPGICLNDKSEMEYWQTQLDSQVKRLTNVFMMTDPVRAGVLGGRPLIQPIIPVITMIDYCWVGQMQQNNRLGAGGLFFIKVIKPQKDDREYAQKIIKNISRGVAYQLRENMEVTNMGLTQTSTALDTIRALDELMGHYFSPASSISTKDGTIIGGSNNSEYELYLSYIEGQQSWVSAAFERMLQPYLDMNGYKGYSIEFALPQPTVDKSELWLKAITTGFDKAVLNLNERRAIMDKITETKELTPEEIQAFADERKQISGAPTDPLAQAQSLAALTNHPLDRYGVVSQEKAQFLANKILKLEEGEQ